MKRDGEVSPGPDAEELFGPRPDDPREFARKASLRMFVQVQWALWEDPEGRMSFWRDEARQAVAIARELMKRRVV